MPDVIVEWPSPVAQNASQIIVDWSSDTPWLGTGVTENVVPPVGPDTILTFTGFPGPPGSPGPAGPPGPPGGDAYVFEQNIPATEWDITHDLGTFPAVTVVDSANRAVYGDITYLDLNNVRLDFSSPFSGFAYLI